MNREELHRLEQESFLDWRRDLAQYFPLLHPD
jgi:hypothetical protein